MYLIINRYEKSKQKREIKMDEDIRLVKYTDEDYKFVYEVKKIVYKKYVEQCWGTWNEEEQKKYFDIFINKVRDNAFIILKGNIKIGFYNGQLLDNGNYEIGNICLLPEYRGKGIGFIPDGETEFHFKMIKPKRKQNVIYYQTEKRGN